MTAEQYAVMLYRLDELERTVRHDHEPRIRGVERVAVKVAVWAAGGSLVGGAVVVAVINTLIK